MLLFSVLLIIYVFYEFTMSLTRRQEVVKSCVEQVIKQLGETVRAEKALYSKRNYAQGSKMKPSDYFYLRLAEFMAAGRVRLLRLNVAEEWIDELYKKWFKVCRKNSRGHTGVSR